MIKLKFELEQYKELIRFKILEQEDIKRDRCAIFRKDRFVLNSTIEQKILICNENGIFEVYLRETFIKKDNLICSIEFCNIEQAKQFYKEFIMFFRDYAEYLNKELGHTCKNEKYNIYECQEENCTYTKNIPCRKYFSTDIDVPNIQIDKGHCLLPWGGSVQFEKINTEKKYELKQDVIVFTLELCE